MRKARIFFTRTDEFWRRGEKYRYLEENQHRGNIVWRELEPDAKHNWLTEGRLDEFELFLPIGNKETKDKSTASAIFTSYSRGVETSRDDWVFNFSKTELIKNIQIFISTFNEHVYRWQSLSNKSVSLDSFVQYDDKKIKWSRKLKDRLVAGRIIEFRETAIRESLYRPFSKHCLYFDSSLVYLPALFPQIFPTSKAEEENRVIAVTSHSQIPFSSQMLNCTPALDVGGRPTQCFPFYTYDEDGSNRRENVTDWAVGEFRGHYKKKSISKWDIFYYVYAVLHHPVYRERYAANLKRELPRVPLVAEFADFARLVEAGTELADLHVNYEQAQEYPLERIENPEAALDWRVEKMRLSKDRRSIIYNDFLTLAGVPLEAFEYRLGNRSALEWVIDQYQVTTDRRSGITNDPNRADDPAYILRLIGQVISVSLQTVKIVQNLPDLGLDKAPHA